VVWPLGNQLHLRHLVGLLGLEQTHLPKTDPMYTKAVQWLKSVQRDDGGWVKIITAITIKVLAGAIVLAPPSKRLGQY